jgi:hypothetical protein
MNIGTVYEIVGKVNDDSTFQMYSTIDLDGVDMEAVKSVVKVTHSFRQIFY